MTGEAWSASFAALQFTAGRPSSEPGNDDDCVTIYPPIDGGVGRPWYDRLCAPPAPVNGYAFLCEIE